MKTTQALLIAFIALFFFTVCDKKNSTTEPTDPERSIVILYTNDEHGWIEESDYSDGSAALMGLWRDSDGYAENENFLVLSGGDNWTGPAISTWFKGESTVDVMNAMNYSASAIGNHEFDFKIDGLKERIAQANFPYLSANIREKSSGDIPEYVVPYIVEEIDDIRIGIIGLTTITTSWSTFPDHVKDLDFLPYASALESIVPQVNEEGIDLIIVLGHICRQELLDLIPIAQNLGIDLMTGGHCNELFSETIEGIVIIEGGAHMASYAKVEIVIDIDTDEIIEITHQVKLNQNGMEDSEVAQVVSYWKSEMDIVLSENIGYTDSEIHRYSVAMHNMVTDSWLQSFPTADISMTNAGGIRQSLAPGDISMATIVGLLPFENSILELELTGIQVVDCVSDLVVGGMTVINGYYHSDGTPLVADSVYRVLTTDYLYSRDDYNFSLYDPTPYNTSVHYRQPVIDWIKSLNTSPANPLTNFLDYTSRRDWN